MPSKGASLQIRENRGHSGTHIRGPRSEENSQWKTMMTLLLSDDTMGFFSKKSSTSSSMWRFIAPWEGKVTGWLAEMGYYGMVATGWCSIKYRSAFDVVHSRFHGNGKAVAHPQHPTQLTTGGTLSDNTGRYLTAVPPFCTGTFRKQQFPSFSKSLNMHTLSSSPTLKSVCNPRHTDHSIPPLTKKTEHLRCL